MPQLDNSIVVQLYRDAEQYLDEPLDCGKTPKEHFITGEDGLLRLQSDHLHL